MITFLRNSQFITGKTKKKTQTRKRQKNREGEDECQL